MSLVLALGLALASAVAYAAGAVLQQRLAVPSEQRVAAGAPAPRAAAPAQQRGSRGRWALAIGLNAAGGALHVLALRYGPLSLIQPLGALTLVFALPASAAFAGRRVTSAEWRGAALTMTGLAGLLLLTRSTGVARALTGTEMVVVLLVTAVALAGLIATAVTVRRPVPRSLWYAIASGVAFGVSSALTQTVAVRISAGGLLTPGVLAGGLAIGALAGAGLLLSQAAYRGGLGAQLATGTLANAVAAGAIGLAVLGEHYAAGTTGAVLALGAAALAGQGVLMLSTPARVGAVEPAAVPAGSPMPAAGLVLSRSGRRPARVVRKALVSAG